MAHLHGKTLRIQRSFARLGIPRLYRSSGTSDPATFKQIEQMLDLLARKASTDSDAGARQMLHDLNSGVVTFLDCLATFQETGAKGLRALSKARQEGKHSVDTQSFARYLQENQFAEATSTNYLHNFKTLSFFLQPTDTLSTLHEALKRYRVSCVKLNRNHRAFNITKAMLQGWVRYTLGEDSEAYRQLKAVKALTLPKKHSTNPYFSPTDIQNIMAYLPEEIAQMVWFQALHGMNVKEMLVDGFTVMDAVTLKIWGAKNSHRHGRVTPLLMTPPVMATTVYSRYHNWLKRASKAAGFDKFGTHDLRRSFIRWCVRAGIPKEVADQYGGWKPQTQSDQYLYADVNTELLNNREKLRSYIEAQLAANPPITGVEKVQAGTVMLGLYGKRVTMMEAMQSERKIAKPFRSKSPMARALAGV